MKPSAQRTGVVLSYSGSMAVGETITASARSIGYARIVGVVYADQAGESGSGLLIEQSIDYGINWDYCTGCFVSACDGEGYSIEIVGDSVRCSYTNGSAIADVRTRWYMRPI